VTFELLHELEQVPAASIEGVFSQTHDSSHPLNGALALVAAAAAGAVRLIGSFQTQVAHSKAVFCLLRHPDTLALLTPEERAFVDAHVPFTTWLKPECIDIASVIDDRAHWIIKPVDGYGTVGVHAGKSFDGDAWQRLIEEKLTEDYIVQEYCEQYRTLNVLPVPYADDGKHLFNNRIEADAQVASGRFAPGEVEPFNVLTGLFAYDGTFSGVYMRAGRDALIVGFRGGVSLASLLVGDNPTQGLAVQPRNIMK
jgi:hypothetical protein